MGNYADIFRISNIGELTVHVYVIGYDPQGETILILIEKSDEIVFSIVTDCNKGKNSNCLSEILDSYKNPKVDLFVWTHPHEDHSVGITELLNKYDPDCNCRIIVPNGIHALKNSGVQLNAPAKSALDFFESNYCQPGNRGRRAKRRYHNVSFDDTFEEEPKIKYLFSDTVTNDEFSVTLSILGPESLTAVQNSTGIVEPYLNHLSVVYMLDVNGLKLFMTGDVSNKGGRCIPDYWFQDYSLLKIPHHGSSEPKSFIKRTFLNENKSSVAISTIFKTKHLPNINSIKSYKKSSSEVYITHDISSDHNLQEYGYVHIRYNAIEQEMVGKPELCGNAWQYKDV